MSRPSTSARHREVFWAAVLLALAAVVGGGIVAYLGYTDSTGPRGAVTGYFAALARGDAPAALGYGDVPAGPRAYLTSTVLAAQQRIAPISDVQVVGVDRRGDSARVSVSYRLGFADGARMAVDSVGVHKSGRSWRLTATAAPVRLRLEQAAGRATLLGGRVPDATVLLFPGAVPISFDTPYLGLAANTRVVRLSDSGTRELDAVITGPGRRAVTSAVHDALAGCVRAAAGPGSTCPLPSGRYVPGSLQGTIAPFTPGAWNITVSGDAGLVTVSGTARFTGRYRELDYDNIAVARSGSLEVGIVAKVYASTPLRVDWAGDAT